MPKFLKFTLAAAVMLAAPAVVHAQGVFRGMERGAAEGNAAAGPLGAVVGGAVGGAVGGVNGVLGINPRPRCHRHWRYEHRSAYRPHRDARYYYHRHYR
ncbi:MAG: hypothetical protein L0Y60_06565 [Beijerinckiaceae bacterium]|nr:hypothetical protein [Beijerinckiaceae bacterium]